MALHRYGLLSDTHGHLHREVFRLFRGVEGIFHAGDVMGAGVLAELETIAPTFAVAGNCDPPGDGLPLLRVENLPFGRLILTHSHLLESTGRDPESLARHFAPRHPRVIVFGHTHRAHAKVYDGVWVVNPGPAGKPRLRDEPSVAVMTWDDQAIQPNAGANARHAGAIDFDFFGVDWSAL